MRRSKSSLSSSKISNCSTRFLPHAISSPIRRGTWRRLSLKSSAMWTSSEEVVVPLTFLDELAKQVQGIIDNPHQGFFQEWTSSDKIQGIRRFNFGLLCKVGALQAYRSRAGPGLAARAPRPMPAPKRHVAIEQRAWSRLFLNTAPPPPRATNHHAIATPEYCAQSPGPPSLPSSVLKRLQAGIQACSALTLRPSRIQCQSIRVCRNDASEIDLL